jgi:hypothetical protein
LQYSHGQALPPEGRQYPDAMSTALLQIERASEQLLGHEESRLRLSVFTSFAVRLPCHSLVAGDKFYFAWRASRRRVRGIQILHRWLASEGIEGGLRGEAG